MGLSAQEVGDFLAGLDDEPIPIPWRGGVYEAPPPDGARGERIWAYWAALRSTPSNVEAMEKALAGESVEDLMIGAETHAALRAAGIPGDALRRFRALCMVRWATGSDDAARRFIASLKAADEQDAGTEDEVKPAPKSPAGSRRRTSRSTASGSRTPKAGTRTT